MSSSTATSSGRLASAFLAELDNEAKVTRNCLERVPADKFDWKPHEKSMTMGRLASHCAENRSALPLPFRPLPGKR